MADDDAIVYIYGDRVSALTWNNRACKILWTDLECVGIIHSLTPMRIVDEEISLKFNKNEDFDEENEKNSNNGSLHSSTGENTTKTDVPHPTLAWIDYVEQKLTFGTINKRRLITRNVKDMPSLPLAIAHVPTLHAIAVLCREHSQFPNYDPIKNDKLDLN
jgi:hypothetical protein